MSYTKNRTLACLPQTTLGESVNLGLCDKSSCISYTNGKNVILRNLKEPSFSQVYSQHKYSATVAKYSPSGFYVASADVSGVVRVWDCNNDSFNLKLETMALSGKVKDLQWDFESKRIIAVGSGKTEFCKAFLFDSGNSVGDMSGHSKVVNSCDLSPKRPFKAITASDDFGVNSYTGVPFKFNKSTTAHKNIVNCVKYSKSGDIFASVGNDRKIVVYDSTTGDKIYDIEDAHDGSIMSLCFDKNSNKLVTCSIDKTLKIWDTETRKMISQISFDTEEKGQQMGCIWADWIVSISFSGYINYYDVNQNKIAKIIQGTQKGLTCLETKKNNTSFFTAGYDGRICYYEEYAPVVMNKAQPTQINDLYYKEDENKLGYVSVDNKYSTIDTSNNKITVMDTHSLPKTIYFNSKDDVLIVTQDSLQLVESSTIVKHTKDIDGQACATCYSEFKKYLAISNKKTIQLFNVDETIKLIEKFQSEKILYDITALSFSKDCRYLAIGDNGGKITVYDMESKSIKLTSWGAHTARIYSIEWSHDNKYAVSGSLDTNIYVWSVETPLRKICIANAHMGGVSCVRFYSNDSNDAKSRNVVSCGFDGMTKIWNVKCP